MVIVKLNSVACKGFMVNVSRLEALQIIESLSAQMGRRSSFHGRKEFRTGDKQEYFSIAVEENK